MYSEIVCRYSYRRGCYNRNKHDIIRAMVYSELPIKTYEFMLKSTQYVLLINNYLINITNPCAFSPRSHCLNTNLL